MGGKRGEKGGRREKGREVTEGVAETASSESSLLFTQKLESAKARGEDYADDLIWK